MSYLLSIDPGEGCGLALWNEGELHHAWLHQCSDDLPTVVDTVVCERPQVYLKNLRAANDLVTLALTAGELVGRIGAPTTYILPATWKGQAPKPICHERIMSALTPEEIGRIELPRAHKKQGDVLDAIGIGLFHLGRVGRGGVARRWVV